MAKGKQTIRFKDGAVVRIPFSENRLVFGRLLPACQIGIYDFVINANAETPALDEICGKTIFLYCTIFKAVITKGYFEIIGHLPLTKNELALIPPTFWQDIMDYKNCRISLYDGTERSATPEECIGLERAIWPESGVIKRIEHHYSNKKYPGAELCKVILNTDDPRYMNPKVRWDFKEEKFIRE